MTTEAKPTSAEFNLEIGGARVSPDFLAKVFTVEVEQNLHLPGIFNIRVHLDATEEQAFDVVDNLMKEFLSKGKEVKISRHVNKRDKAILVGEVNSVSLDLGSTVPGAAPFALIQGYDKSHRLHRGRHTQTFINMSYSDIATKICQDAGLQADVDATSGVFDYTIQYNQTNWEFLWQIASRIGYEAYLDGNNFCFKQPWKSQRGSLDLEWGSSLSQFRLRASTAFQPTEVTVRGWDPKAKAKIIGQATAGQGKPKLGDDRSGPAQAKSAFGDAKLTVVDKPVHSQAEADAMAQSLADVVAGDFVIAEGVTAEGTPEIVPGVTLNITKLGERFSGRYYVTSSTHVFSSDEGYSTAFVVSGRRPNTLVDVIDSGHKPGPAGRGGGVVVGLVTDNNDPDDLSRVKVEFPWLGDQVESTWARIAAPGAGKDRGMHWLPEVGDEVLVAFELGDVHRPFVLGGLWNQPDSPAAKNSEVVGGDGSVNLRIIRSRAGHVIILDDSDGAEKIIVRDKTQKNEIIIDSGQNTLTVNVEKDVTVRAKGAVTVESTQDLVLKSSANMSLEATGNIQVEASGNLTMKGGAQASVEAGAQMSIKGAQTSVEGSATAELKGGLVRIN